MSDHLLWRDGQKIFGCEQPRKQTPDELYEEMKMKHRPNQCPPILHGDCQNMISDFVKQARHVTNANTGETAGPTDSQVAASFAVFVGLQNVAGYLSAAINNGSGEIAEALNRLARAVENLSPVEEPPTLVRLKVAAQRIGISSDALMRLSLRGEFPAVIRIADMPFFRESDIDKWLTERAA